MVVDPTTVDEDGDGYNANVDCNDDDSLIRPDRSDPCDGIDNDCDGLVDEGRVFYADEDGDGYGDPNNAIEACSAPLGYTTDNTDCDDTNSHFSPMAKEGCDGYDNDCDGVVDNVELADEDGDGYFGCEDCDDHRASVYPGAEEVCDGHDNDCNGQIDENNGGVDEDGDGYAGCDDCNDSDAVINPGEDEYCDGVDNNCDGRPDEATAVDAPTWYLDMDGNGCGDPAKETLACTQPPEYVSEACE